MSVGENSLEIVLFFLDLKKWIEERIAHIYKMLFTEIKFIAQNAGGGDGLSSIIVLASIFWVQASTYLIGKWMLFL